MSTRSKSARTNDSDALKESVESTLAKVEHDFEEIEQRLTPGYFVDRAIFANRNMNPRSALDALQENPFGTTFLSLGTLMLARRQDGKTGEDILHDVASASTQRAKEDAQEGTLTSIREEMSAKASQAKGRVTKAKDSVTRVKDRLQAKGHEYLDMDNVSPLTLASLGLGLGAAVGASLPEHARERDAAQHYGAELEQIKSEVQEATTLALERMKDALADELKAVHFS